MHEETGGPKNSHTTDADQNNRQAESKEYGELSCRMKRYVRF